MNYLINKIIFKLLITRIGRKILKIKALDKYFANKYIVWHSKLVAEAVDKIDPDTKDIKTIHVYK